MAGVQQFVMKYFLILGLLVVIPLGLLFPGPGAALMGLELGGLSVVRVAILVIFLVNGVSLGSITDCLELKALGGGVGLILGITPLLIFPVLLLRDVGLLQPHLAHGMAVFCVVPTTLSSGVVMVGQSHGNVPLAVLLTATANSLGTATLPLATSLIFKAYVKLDVWPIFRDLAITMFLPLAMGMLTRKAVPGAAGWVTAHKSKLTILNNCCILLCVWMTTSSTRDLIVKTHFLTLLLLVVLGVLLHSAKLAVAFVATLFCNERERRTLILMCSQKSLPVCLSVLAALPSHLQPYVGFMAIPCIVGHTTQLLMDAVLVSRWSDQPIPESKPLADNPEEASAMEGKAKNPQDAL